MLWSLRGQMARGISSSNGFNLNMLATQGVLANRGKRNEVKRILSLTKLL